MSGTCFCFHHNLPRWSACTSLSLGYSRILESIPSMDLISVEDDIFCIDVLFEHYTQVNQQKCMYWKDKVSLMLKQHLILMWCVEIHQVLSPSMCVSPASYIMHSLQSHSKLHLVKHVYTGSTYNIICIVLLHLLTTSSLSFVSTSNSSRLAAIVRVRSALSTNPTNIIFIVARKFG